MSHLMTHGINCSQCSDSISNKYVSMNYKQYLVRVIWQCIDAVGWATGQAAVTYYHHSCQIV